MTNAQHKALGYIRILRDKWARECTTGTPTEWVFGCKLRPLGVRESTLDAMVKAGILETRPSGGSGPQYRIINK